MATFRIKAHTKVEVWQDVSYEVEADSPEEAKEKVLKNPQRTAIGYDTIDDTDKFLLIDFENGGDGENIRLE